MLVAPNCMLIAADHFCDLFWGIGLSDFAYRIILAGQRMVDCIWFAYNDASHGNPICNRI